MKRRNGTLWGVLLAMPFVFFVMTSPAAAAVVDLGGGWQASWDSSLDGKVNLETVEVTGEALVIRKTAEFTQGPVSGIFPAIPIVFTQTSAIAAKHIVIDEESVLNSTGVDWTDFHLDVLGGGTVFNPAATGASGGPLPIGWRIDPFTQAAFSGTLKRLDIWGGVVADGQTWQPGSDPTGANGGQLWLDVFPNPDAFVSFSLKETPTPEPATLGLLALGGAVMFSRRRRRTVG